MKQPTTVGRNVSWPYIATGGLQVMVFSPDMSPSAAAQNDSIWNQKQKKLVVGHSLHRHYTKWPASWSNNREVPGSIPGYTMGIFP
jgi:hypothetical protein